EHRLARAAAPLGDAARALSGDVHLRLRAAPAFSGAPDALVAATAPGASGGGDVRDHRGRGGHPDPGPPADVLRDGALLPPDPGRDPPLGRPLDRVLSLDRHGGRAGRTL